MSVMNQFATTAAAADVTTATTAISFDRILAALGLVPAASTAGTTSAEATDTLTITFEEGECEPIIAKNVHGTFVYIKTAQWAKVRGGENADQFLRNFSALIDVVQHYDTDGVLTGTLPVLATKDMDQFTVNAMVRWNHYGDAVNCRDQIEFV